MHSHGPEQPKGNIQLGYHRPGASLVLPQVSPPLPESWHKGYSSLWKRSRTLLDEQPWPNRLGSDFPFVTNTLHD